MLALVVGNIPQVILVCGPGAELLTLGTRSPPDLERLGGAPGCALPVTVSPLPSPLEKMAPTVGGYSATHHKANIEQEAEK